MLLSKQPGDTGLFATATATHVSLYSVHRPFSVTPPSTFPLSASAAARSGRGDTRDVFSPFVSCADAELPDDHSRIQWSSGYTPASPCAAEADSAAAERHTRYRWGPPLKPLASISIAKAMRSAEQRREATHDSPLATDLSGARAGLYSDARGGGGHAAAATADDGSNFLPTSLSLSCATQDTHFFLSDRRGGAWIGRAGTSELTALRAAPPRGGLTRHPSASTHAAEERPEVRGSTSSSASGASLEDAERGHASSAQPPSPTRVLSSAGSVVNASGWDPRNAATLAVGREDAVVQLLDVEYLLGEVGGGGVRAAPPTSNALRGVTSRLYSAKGPRWAGSAASSSTSSPGDSLQYSIIQERLMEGPVTAMDWVPLSHLTVVAAQREDGLGYYAELLDLRSPDGGLRYLGAPPGVFGTTYHYRGLDARSAASSYVLCYAEHVACDTSQRYVATVGSQHNRDIMQLWDVRAPTRPLHQGVYRKTGYTSLCWSPAESMTVVGTVRGGGLRVHTFDAALSGGEWADSGGTRQGRRGDGRDGGELDHWGGASARRGDSGSEAETEDAADEVLSGHSFGGTTISSAEGGGALFATRLRPQSAASCRLPSRVPSAAVAWVAPPRPAAAAAPEAGVSSAAWAVDASRPPVCPGGSSDVPLLLLLNMKNGELYAQAYNRQGAVVAMAGEAPLVAAGPNVFLVAYAQQYAAQRAAWQAALLRQMERDNWAASSACLRAAADASPTHSADGADDYLFPSLDSSEEDEDEPDGGLHDRGSRSSVITSPPPQGNASTRGVGAEADEPAARLTGGQHAGRTATPEQQWALGGVGEVERTALALGRLQQGFSADAERNLAILVQEGLDREAYCLFSYGHTLSWHLFAHHGGLPPAHKAVPGLLELIVAERSKREQYGLLDTALPLAGESELAPRPSSPTSAPPHPAAHGVTGGSSQSGGGGARPPVARSLAQPFPKSLPLPTVFRGGQRAPPPPPSAATTAHGGGGLAGHPLLGTVRSLVLRSMRWWTPRAAREAQRPAASPRDAGSDAAAASAVENFFMEGDGIGMSSLQEALERRVAVLTLMEKLEEASALLALYGSYHPLYPTIALELSAAGAVRGRRSPPGTPQEPRHTAGGTFWLDLARGHVEDVVAPARAAAGGSSGPPTEPQPAGQGGCPTHGGTATAPPPSRADAQPLQPSQPPSFHASSASRVPELRHPSSSVGSPPATPRGARSLPAAADPADAEARKLTETEGTTNLAEEPWSMSSLPLPTQQTYVLTLLRRYPRLLMSDKVGLAAALLLPPRYKDVHLLNFLEVLQVMVQQQYIAYYPGVMTTPEQAARLGKAGATATTSSPPAQPSSADAAPRGSPTTGAFGVGGLRGPPRHCSLLLTCAVESVGPEHMAVQRYVDETADVQTPLCYVTAFGSTRGSTYQGWREAYRAWQNDGAFFILRSQHDLLGMKVAKARGEGAAGALAAGASSPSALAAGSEVGGAAVLPAAALKATFSGLELGPSALISAHNRMKRPFGPLGPASERVLKHHPPHPGDSSYGGLDQHRAVELRCNCGQPMQATAPSKGSAPTNASHTRKPMAPCGNADCRQWQTPMCTVCGERMEHRAMEVAPERSFAWCTVCLHGGHWIHLREWFAKHSKCAVEDCPCRCCEGEPAETAALLSSRAYEV